MKKLVAIVVVMSFLFNVNHAQEKPADSMIKSTMTDLDRYEKQAEGLTPKHKANINRILRFLPMTEARLKRSRHKDHASWTAANDRLQALKTKLEALRDGKSASVAQPAVEKETGKSALSDSELAKKYQQDFRTLSNDIKKTHISKLTDEKTVSDLRKRFADLKQTVDSLKDPKYKTTFTTNYKNLEKWFDQRVASANKQKTEHAAADAARTQAEKARQAKATEEKTEAKDVASSAALDYQNKRALQFFNKDYDRYQKEFEIIDPKKIDILDGYIGRLENRASKMTAKTHPKVVEANAKLAALKTKLAAVKNSRPANALSKEDDAVHQEFQKLFQKNRVAYSTLTPTDLANPIEAKHWKKVLSQFEVVVGKFKNKETPLVKADLKQYQEIKAKVNSGLNASEKLSLAKYPNLKQDLDFLNSLYKKYSENKIFSEKNEALAKRLITDYPNDKKAYDKLAKQYATFIEGNATANSPNYKTAGDLKRNMRNAGDWMGKFEKAQKEYIENAVPDIEKLLKKAREMVDQAVKEKRTAWFTGGGIEHAMIRAESRLNSFAAIKGSSDPQVKRLKSDYSALAANVKKAEENLKEAILASRKMPNDVYRGSDKNTVLKMAVKEWQKKHADKNVLAKGISMPNWERKTEWRWESVGNKRYKVDRSYIQVWVIVKTNDIVATQYFVEFNKDHTQGDKITVNAPTNLTGSVLKTEMLMKNVK